MQLCRSVPNRQINQLNYCSQIQWQWMTTPTTLTTLITIEPLIQRHTSTPALPLTPCIPADIRRTGRSDSPVCPAGTGSARRLHWPPLGSPLRRWPRKPGRWAWASTSSPWRPAAVHRRRRQQPRPLHTGNRRQQRRHCSGPGWRWSAHCWGHHSPCPTSTSPAGRWSRCCVRPRWREWPPPWWRSCRRNGRNY